MSEVGINKSDRICDFYLTEKGCVKGAECDFDHPQAPNGTVTNHVCDFFGTPRGCNKGDSCEYLHLTRLNPQGQPATRVCDFYLQPSGCIKGFQCDFLHPRAKPARYNLHASGRGLASIRGGGAGESKRVVKTCQYISTPEGCKKGAECDFIHPNQTTAGSRGQGRPTRGRVGANGHRGMSIIPAGRKVDKECMYYNTPEGCKKGAECQFIHKKNKPCSYFQQGTCKKGDACDFQHVSSQ